jgi:hypothetical protein
MAYFRFGSLAAVALASTLVVACGDDSGSSSEESGNELNGANGVLIGPDGLPVGPDGQPLASKLDGKYELTSEFDLTSAGLLPETVNDTLKALSNFKEKPSKTLVDLLDVANVPVVPNLLNAIPGLLRDPLFNFIDDHIFKAVFDKVPVIARITGLLDDMASIVTQFGLVSTLDLPSGDGIGDSRAQHALSGVAYRWDDKLHVIKAPDVVATLSAQTVDANAVALEKRSVDLESGRLKLGDHTFSVPIGTFAVKGIDELARDRFHASDLRDALGRIVDCDALAESVSKRCINPPGPGQLCVGHKSEVKQVCSVGLDLLVGTLQGAIKKLDIPVLNLKEGYAQMWDAPKPGAALDATIDRIDHGFWTAAIQITGEDKPVVATFEGHRVGDTAEPSRPSPR